MEDEIKLKLLREREEMLRKLTERPDSKFANQVDEFHRAVLRET